MAGTAYTNQVFRLVGVTIAAGLLQFPIATHTTKDGTHVQFQFQQASGHDEILVVNMSGTEFGILSTRLSESDCPTLMPVNQAQDADAWLRKHTVSEPIFMKNTKSLLPNDIPSMLSWCAGQTYDDEHSHTNSVSEQKSCFNGMTTPFVYTDQGALYPDDSVLRIFGGTLTAAEIYKYLTGDEAPAGTHFGISSTPTQVFTLTAGKKPNFDVLGECNITEVIVDKKLGELVAITNGKAGMASPPCDCIFGGVVCQKDVTRVYMGPADLDTCVCLGKPFNPGSAAWQQFKNFTLNESFYREVLSWEVDATHESADCGLFGLFCHGWLTSLITFAASILVAVLVMSLVAQFVLNRVSKIS
jgi:hypothetical protein